MQKIVPNVWCVRNAEEVAAFITSAFENAHAEIESRYPHDGLLDIQREFAGRPLTVALTISGMRFTLINAGEAFRPNPSISFMINFDPLLFDDSEEYARASLDRLWERLGEGGAVLMPLGEYPFSRRYGWVQDRYGINWQLILTDPGGDPRPFIMTSLLFCGRAQNRAREAVEFYVSIFEDAAAGMQVPYGQAIGPASAEALMFSDFRIGEQWFTAADSAVAMESDFSPGMSLEVRCADQAEIDRLWAALSAVPEAEQCGWLVDRFGVSWQIVPRDMGELMERPGAFQRMLDMTKIVIADL